MIDLFISIYHYFQRKKLLFFSIVGVLFAVCVYFAVQIKLEEDIAGFMPDTAETERTNFVLKNLSTSDKIIIKLSVSDSSIADVQDYLTSCADTLVDSLKVNPGEKYIKSVFYKIDDSKIAETFDFVLQNLPLYLNESDYQRLDSMLTPEVIKATLEQDRKELISPMGLIYKKYIIADPLHISNRIFADLSSKAIDSLYNNYNGYIFSKDDRNLLIFITSAYSVGETGKNEVLAMALEKNIESIKERSCGRLSVTSFGAAIVGVSNASQIKKDSYISTAISVILIVLLLGLFFKNIRSLLLLLVPVAFGAVFSLALLFFIKGTISAIAIGAGSAILGIAINYTLHFLVHYKHSGSVELTIKDLTSPLVLGSITTIGAFLSLLFVSSSALGDFGLFAALALIGTILFVFVFMPSLVKWKSSSVSAYPAFFDHISDIRLDKNKWVIIVIFLLTIIFGFFSGHLEFESDMNKISYMTSEQKKAFTELTAFTNLSEKSIIHVSEGRTPNLALRNYESAKIKIDSLLLAGTIKSVAGIANMALSDSLQKKKIDRWNEFWSDRKQGICELFENKGINVGFKKNSFNGFIGLVNKEYVVQNPDHLLLENDLSSGYIINKPGRVLIISLLYVAPENEEVVKKTLNAPGTFLFDRASATKATIGVLSNDFNFVLLVCALLVLLFLTISFGRFELSLLTFIPMIIGWIWILGLMAVFNIKFNIVNIILATFIFGLGDDYSIFIMEGSMHEYACKRKILSSYRLAVILSALTMFIGIGSLIFAKHPAMKSLAQVTIIGMISVVVISYTILPFLYRWLTSYKGKNRIYPVTARNLFNTIYSFSVFLIGSLILSLIGFFLFKATRPNDRKKLFFHKCLAFTAGFVAVRIPQVRTHFINKGGEDFTKPSVIICNHQSHIDLMYIMMLSPRIVILTNEWVWNSPFYGNIVKYADFFPVADGIEKSMEPLAEMVKKGYSIMIFPEGTRSEDCSINRFHKGAFYLAEQLKLDILPVIIHGMGYVFPKKDFILHKGSVTVEILDRIKPDDKSYGESYSHRPKYIRQLYKAQYLRIATGKESPEYYADKLYHNYIYKGPAISTKVRIDLKRHNNYSEIIKCLPDNGRVLVLGAGLGSFPLLLSMVKPELIIDAVESDEDKLALARNCASCTEKISYINSDPFNFDISHLYDAIILMDCLSAFGDEKQKQIIRNCVSHSSLLLFPDARYILFDKIFLKLNGNNLQKKKKPCISDLRKLSDELCFSLTQTDNMITISKTK
ncbi:MAG: 1-acyl-sn-glycerol-3-phosphate acyltransferase [Bacteroidales bacterium]|nr:1-acyl-sn-glycerol-3-phosphate acyltransferase [Bacteroidales bacterium]